MRPTSAVAASVAVLVLAAFASAQTLPLKAEHPLAGLAVAKNDSGTAITTSIQEPRGRTALGDVDSACCEITSIDIRERKVTAVDRASRRIIQFEVPDQGMLSGVKLGQKVKADFSAHRVSIDGTSMCCVLAVQPIPRFQVLCGGDCVADRWTGYIWESTPIPTAESLSQAGSHCSSLNSIHPPSSLTSDTNALQRGWGVPYIWELGTLPDPTLPGSTVPPNTFFNVQAALYWGIGGNPAGHSEVLARVFGTPFGGVGVVQPQSVNLMVWC